MKIKELTDIIEAAADLSWQAGYDNAGLIVGDSEAEVGAALLCVDITESVLEQAIEVGAGLIIAHHPIIFHGLKQITGQTYIQRVVAKALQHGIALYACHTNLDSAPLGISHRLGDMFGLKEIALLEPTRTERPDVGFGIVGELPDEESVEGFLNRVKSVLGLKALRYSRPYKKQVRRVAICSGSGGSLIGKAKEAGADVYIAADFKYNDFLDADRELVIADAGHFETEYCAIDILFEIIRKKIPTFALYKSNNSENPVNYLV